MPLLCYKFPQEGGIISVRHHIHKFMSKEIFCKSFVEERGSKQSAGDQQQKKTLHKQNLPHHLLKEVEILLSLLIRTSLGLTLD